MADASRLRGLAIKSPIHSTYLDREQFQGRLMELLRREYPPGEVQADERLLKAFGLIPEETDLRELYMRLYTERAAGFYDPKTQAVYVLNTGEELNAHTEITYAHEVIHALQDQHYDLEALIKPFEDKNDDAALAISALTEGDATVLQGVYLVSKPELMGRIGKAIQDEQSRTRPVKNIPPILLHTASFPYSYGQNFVMSLRQHTSQ